MRPDSLTFLRTLLDTPSPSGFERAGQQVWLSYVRPFADRCWNDAYGNCFASVEPSQKTKNPFTLALCGHADEIGLMVNFIDPNGFVYCKSIGGIDAGSIVGKRVQFMSSVAGVAQPVAGLIGATAIHLQDKANEGKMRKLHELYVDIGAKDQASAQALLNIGDPGVFMDQSMLMGDGLIVARGLDNRVGTFAAAEGLRLIAEQRANLKVRVVAVSTVQEEVGLHGASMIAASLHPTVALVTDVGHATDSPGINHPQHGHFKLGGGPKVSVGGAAQPEVSARIFEVAKARNIVVQRGGAAGRTGTDTDAIFVKSGGIPSGLVSLPIRYMHTTVEMTALKDLEQIAEIFAGFALGLAGDEVFAPQL
ncbi:MAG: M42 family peptidase [Planctomycetes bacterium]|nr:M42 family peptidase [Planctomycetota bacterium]